MKINRLSYLQNVYRKQVEKEQPKGEISKKHDQLEISNEAKLMQHESNMVTERKERIEALKAQVQSGDYKVNPQAVAKKFYEFWNE